LAVLAEYRTGAIMAQALAATVAGQLAEALAMKGTASLAVPGGSTPGPFLRALSGADINWRRVKILLTDERFVRESNARSNTALLRKTLLQGPAASAQLVAMYLEAETPEMVLDQIEKSVLTALPLDVSVLGMGADMHTASLFPEADNLTEALKPDGTRAVFAMRAPGAPEPRLTLSASVLRAASHLHLLITGPEKLAAFHQAEQSGPTSQAPVRAILTAPNGVTVHYCEKPEAT